MNIVCVLSVEQTKFTKVKYTEEWVDKLYNSVKRNYSGDYNFFCLSNIDTKYNTIKLESNSKGFWNKIEIFKHFKEPTLYIDLDVVILNNFTKLVKKFQNYNFLMTKEPFENISNSSIMFWKNDYSFLYDEYIANKDNVLLEYKNVPRYGDQAYIAERVEHKFIEDIKDSAVSWKHHIVKTAINKKSNFLIFTSHQSKPNNTDLDIVKRNWV